MDETPVNKGRYLNQNYTADHSEAHYLTNQGGKVLIDPWKTFRLQFWNVGQEDSILYMQYVKGSVWGIMEIVEREG